MLGNRRQAARAGLADALAAVGCPADTLPLREETPAMRGRGRVPGDSNLAVRAAARETLPSSVEETRSMLGPSDRVLFHGLDGNGGPAPLPPPLSAGEGDVADSCVRAFPLAHGGASPEAERFRARITAAAGSLAAPGPRDAAVLPKATYDDVDPADVAAQRAATAAGGTLQVHGGAETSVLAAGPLSHSLRGAGDRTKALRFLPGVRAEVESIARASAGAKGTATPVSGAPR